MDRSDTERSDTESSEKLFKKLNVQTATYFWKTAKFLVPERNGPLLLCTEGKQGRNIVFNDCVNIVLNEFYVFYASELSVVWTFSVRTFSIWTIRVGTIHFTPLLDIEKAFDGVWHDALIHKLMVAGFPKHLVKITASFLRNRNSSVSVSDKSSDLYSVPAGVPQGSPLSPFLYNIFTNDTPIQSKRDLPMTLWF